MLLRNKRNTGFMILRRIVCPIFHFAQCLGCCRPYPPLRQLGQAGGVGRGRFVFALALPLAAAGFEDALQELSAGLVAAALAGEFGFGFDEAAFDGGFVALEVGDGFVEAGELFFDFRDDAFLLVEGDNGNR